MGKQMSLKEFKELLPMLKDEVLVTIGINDEASTNNEVINMLKDYILLLEELNSDFLLPVDIEIKIDDTIEILRYNIQYQEKTSVKLEDIISSITIENLMNLSHDLYILTRCNKVTDLCDQLIKLLNIKENADRTKLDKVKDSTGEHN